jgi:hypothetical protein
MTVEGKKTHETVGTRDGVDGSIVGEIEGERLGANVGLSFYQ